MTTKIRLVGQGPAKVLLAHTWLADHQTYTPMMSYLDGDSFAWAFPDFRGYGTRKHAAGDFTVEEMALDLLASADDLGWSRFHLVGHSMGGQASQWLAGHAPDRVQSLTLLSSVPAAGFPLDADTAAFFAATASDPVVRGQVAGVVTGNRLGAGFADFMVRSSSETATDDAIDRYLRTWTGQDVSGSIGRYDGPVHAFAGEHDPVLTEEVTRQAVVPLFPQAHVSVVSGAGHYPPIETPARTAAILCETIGGLS